MLIMEKRQEHAMDSRRAEKWHMRMTRITLGAGVKIIDVNVVAGSSLGIELSMPPTDLYGVRIQSVEPGSDADKAGCKAGMVIVAVNGTVTLTSEGDWADLWDLRQVHNVIKSTVPGRIALAVADADEYDSAVQNVHRAHWMNEPEARPSGDDDVKPAWMDDLDIANGTPSVTAEADPLTGLTRKGRQEVQAAQEMGMPKADIDMLIAEKEEEAKIERRRSKKLHMQLSAVTLGVDLRKATINVPPRSGGGLEAHNALGGCVRCSDRQCR